MPDVLDASAALAYLKDEPGADVVHRLLRTGVMSAVNWSEVLQKARAGGADPGDVAAMLEGLGVVVIAATAGDGVLAARFWEHRSPLSLADRFCLALASRLDCRVVTADRSWADLDTGAEILLIR